MIPSDPSSQRTIRLLKASPTRLIIANFVSCLCQSGCTESPKVHSRFQVKLFANPTVKDRLFAIKSGSPARVNRVNKLKSRTVPTAPTDRNREKRSISLLEDVPENAAIFSPFRSTENSLLYLVVICMHLWLK